MLYLNRLIISEEDQNECVGVYSNYTLLGIEDSLRSQLKRIPNNRSHLPIFHAIIAYFSPACDILTRQNEFKISFTNLYDSESTREKEGVNIFFLGVRNLTFGLGNETNKKKFEKFGKNTLVKLFRSFADIEY